MKVNYLTGYLNSLIVAWVPGYEINELSSEFSWICKIEQFEDLTQREALKKKLPLEFTGPSSLTQRAKKSQNFCYKTLACTYLLG